MVALDQGGKGGKGGRGEKWLAFTCILKIEPRGLLKDWSGCEGEAYGNTPRPLPWASGWNARAAVNWKGQFVGGHRSGEQSSALDMQHLRSCLDTRVKKSSSQ